MRFRDRKIHVRNTYPSVYWPDHPLAYSDGMVYVHRIVAYEKYGNIPDTCHVHHIDEDKWNWSPENLEILTPSEHTTHHNMKDPVVRFCGHCGKPLKLTPSRSKKRKRVYCGTNCYGKGIEKIDWPSDAELQKLLSESSRESVGRMLGVTGNAIKKRLRVRTPSA